MPSASPPKTCAIAKRLVVGPRVVAMVAVKAEVEAAQVAVVQVAAVRAVVVLVAAVVVVVVAVAVASAAVHVLATLTPCRSARMFRKRLPALLRRTLRRRAEPTNRWCNSGCASGHAAGRGAARLRCPAGDPPGWEENGGPGMQGPSLRDRKRRALHASAG